MGELADQENQEPNKNNEAKAEEVSAEHVQHEHVASGSSNHKSFVEKVKALAKIRKNQIAGGVVLLVLILAFVDPVKYPILNVFAKASADVVVLDSQTSSPIDGASVTISGITAKTDNKGKAHLSKIKFGNDSIKVSKIAYADNTIKAKVGLGSNLIGPIKIKPEGLPVSVKATNKLTKAKIDNFKISIDGTEVSAIADADGLATLSVPPSNLGKLTLVGSADGYNDSKTSVTLVAPYTSTSFSVELTPAGKDYFLTNRNGTVDVYSSDFDGENQESIISGTGKEDSTTTLITSPKRDSGILISKRDGQKDSSGTIVEAVYAINYESKTIKRIDEGAPVFTFIGWIDDSNFVYSVNYNQYTKSDNAKIKKANLKNSELSTLYTTKGYPAITFFAEEPTHVYVGVGDSSVVDYGLVSIDLVAKKSSRIYTNYLYSFTQTKPYYVAATDSTTNKWHEINLNDQSVSDIATPDTSKNLRYSLSPSGNKLAWLENRDGKINIIVGDSAGNNGKNISKNEQVASILGWVGDDYIIYRFQSSDDTSDRIVDVSGGNIQKIANTYGYAYTYYNGNY